MQSTGLYNQARLLPGEDISYALVDYAPDGIDKATYDDLMGNRFLKEKPGVLKVSDPAQLELCLQDYQDSYTEQPVYAILFKLKNGSSFSGLFPPAEVPDFIKEHFAQ